MDFLENQKFDIIVIGGGATGSSVCLDASLREYRVLLLEKGDFGSQSSSKSSKLVHGGVRYLEKAFTRFDKSQYDLVKEALEERAIFLENAPHLAKKLKINIPIYNYFSLLYTYIGIFIYKFISGKKNIGKNSLLNKTSLNLLNPNIKKKSLKGAISFYDGKFLDFKMVISILQTSQYYGATLRNYSEVTNFLYDNKGKICGVEFEDKFSNKKTKVYAKVVVNATGANVDKLRTLDDENIENILQFSTGVHIVLDKKFLPYEEGILIPKTKDGRVIFVLPFLGKCLIGTTDNPTNTSDVTKSSNEEIEYLLEHINQYFETKITKADILSTWSGTRALAKSNKKKTQQIVREHIINVTKNRLVSIAGGKWTTYRKMGEELVDFLVSSNFLQHTQGSLTKEIKLLGSTNNLKLTYKLLDSYPITKETKESLISLYGSRAVEVLNIAKEHNNFSLIDEKLPYLKAEIEYCARYEYIKKPMDFLIRRVGLALIDKKKALDCVETVSVEMAKALLWSEERIFIEKHESYDFINENF